MISSLAPNTKHHKNILRMSCPKHFKPERPVTSITKKATTSKDNGVMIRVQPAQIFQTSILKI
jgi:hypothetical protein